MNLEHHLLAATQAADLAGDYLRERQAHNMEVLSQKGRDIKLALDRESETIILERLRQTSDFPILTEETGEHGAIVRDEPFWVVDPIDGTMNFYRGLPMYCISIALWQGDRGLLGVIYDFDRDIRYTAIEGGGAFANGKPITASGLEEPGQAIIATGFPSSSQMDDETLLTYFRLIRTFKKVRMIGSAALAACYVGTGFVDAYGEDGTNLWDVAAAVTIVREAGGWASIEERPEQPWKLNVRCASSPKLWE